MKNIGRSCTFRTVNCSHNRVQNEYRCFSNKAWMHRHINDQYVKQAVEGDLRSRSAFKLIQLQKDYSLIKTDSYVIDLGSAPGGWSVACAGFLRLGINAAPSVKPPPQRTSSAASVAPSTFGYLCSVDLLDMKPVSGTHFIQGDFRSATVQSQIEAVGEARGKQADCVLSDMLQNVSGQHDVDHFRSIELSLTALEFCSRNLKPGGTFLCKFLRGSDDKDLLEEAQKIFSEVRLVKPKASRSESSEIYLLARSKLNKPA